MRFSNCCARSGELFSLRRNKGCIRFKLIESFFTISQSVSGSYKEKGSKFLAFAHPVADYEQIKAKLIGLRKEFYDARHHCYAWVLGADKSRFKVFDDGEPSHSAGDPIFNQIKSKNLTNILIIVARYFGGVKLGVSGLTNAYKLAASDALKKASIIEVVLTKSFIIKYEYKETSQIKKLVNEFKLKVIEETFGELCSVAFEVSIAKAEKLKSRVETLSLQGYPVQLI